MSLDNQTSLRREWIHGLRNLWRFIRGSGGLDSAMEAMFALAGPTVEREFDEVRRPSGGETELLAHSLPARI